MVAHLSLFSGKRIVDQPARQWLCVVDVFSAWRVTPTQPQKRKGERYKKSKQSSPTRARAAAQAEKINSENGHLLISAKNNIV